MDCLPNLLTTEICKLKPKMIKVYFESDSHAEPVAFFENEETYSACFGALEALAKENRMIVTESVIDELELCDLLD